MSENAFEGLRDVLGSLGNGFIQQGKPLTLQDFDQFVSWLGSDEYAAQFRERERVMWEGEQLLARAYQQDIITQAEYYRLFESISINGALIVSPTMSERLKQVKD